jgi:hypothetical protein
MQDEFRYSKKYYIGAFIFVMLLLTLPALVENSYFKV